MLRLGRFACAEVGDGLAVADTCGSDVSLLNSGAAVIWLLLGEGAATPLELTSRAAECCAVTVANWATEVEQLLMHWQTLGWCDGDRDGRWRMVAEAPDLPQILDVPAPLLHANSRTLWSRRIALDGISIEATLTGSVDALVEPEFQRRAGFMGGFPVAREGGATTSISLFFGSDSAHVTLDGSVRGFSNHIDASTFFNDCCIRSLYPSAHAHTMLHAAAVSRDDGCVLLPATGGSGKTTLTAHLVARGWRYGGDDVIGLGRGEPGGAIGLLPFPSALGIKEGSVPFLVDDYPELATLAPVAYGNKTVRFLPIGQEPLAPRGTWRRPSALVFPGYHADATASLVPIDEWQALSLLLEAGTGTSLGTDIDSFELLVELVRSLPRYQLRYSSLEDATRLLENMT